MPKIGQSDQNKKLYKQVFCLFYGMETEVENKKDTFAQEPVAQKEKITQCGMYQPGKGQVF